MVVNLELSLSPSNTALVECNYRDKVVLGRNITKESHLGCRHLGFAKNN